MENDNRDPVNDDKILLVIILFVAYNRLIDVCSVQVNCSATQGTATDNQNPNVIIDVTLGANQQSIMNEELAGKNLCDYHSSIVCVIIH